MCRNNPSGSASVRSDSHTHTYVQRNGMIFVAFQIKWTSGVRACVCVCIKECNPNSMCQPWPQEHGTYSNLPTQLDTYVI